MLQCFAIVCIALVLRCYSENINEITVPLKYGESELSLTFPATVRDASLMATKFCSEKVMAVDQRLDECLQTVGEYLTSSVEKFVRTHRDNEKVIHEDSSTNHYEILTVSLQIGTAIYDIEYKYESEESIDTAKAFCVKNMATFGISPSTLSSCIDPVISQLDTALEKHLKSKGKSIPRRKTSKKPVASEQTITLDIGGTNYDLIIDQSKESVEVSATRFCTSKLDIFDLNHENVKELCADPIIEYVKSIVK